MFKGLLKTIQTGAAPGQAIVIMAVAMVALLSVLGLAVDGGGLLLLQRSAQNATDAAVLAATYARCTNTASGVVAAGRAAAAANGFNNDGVSNTVAVNYPPTRGEKAGDMGYVEVIIHAVKTPYFIQLVYKGELAVTVQAVGYCMPPFEPVNMPGLWANSTTCGNTIDWSGSTGRLEGGMHSNNEIKMTGSDNTIIGNVGAVTAVDNPSSGNNTFTPPYTTGVSVVSYPEIITSADYAPGGEIARSVQANDPTAYHSMVTAGDDPDYNGSRWSPNNRTLRGVYYVVGDIQLGNNNIYHTDGVVFVATGQIKAMGGVSWRYYNTGYAAVLLLSDYVSPNCGDTAIDVSGNTTIWYGIVWAPRANVSISGSELTMYGAVIANKINMSGSELTFQYDPDMIPPRPPLVQIAE